MTKLIRLNKEATTLLDTIKEGSYSNTIIKIINSKQIVNYDSKQIVNTNDNRIELILKEVQLIKEEIRNRTN